MSVNVNAQPNLYASGNTGGIVRTNSNDPYVNSALSGKVNTNVGGTIVNPTNAAIIGTAPVTTVPYTTTGSTYNAVNAYPAGGVYTSGISNQGYNNPQIASVNKGTQQVRQTVTTTAPGYAYQQQTREARGQNSGMYERRTVETTPIYSNTTYNAPQPANNVPLVPLAASSNLANRPAVVQTRYTESNQPQTYVHQEQKASWWRKPLLALIGLLALAGIILGLLFGLGVIGGNKNVLNPSYNGGTNNPDQAVLIDGVSYNPYSITKETTVINSTADSSSTVNTNTVSVTPVPATPVSVTPVAISPIAVAPTAVPVNQTTTSTTTTTTVVPATMVATSTTSSTRPTTTVSTTATEPTVFQPVAVSPIAVRPVAV